MGIVARQGIYNAISLLLGFGIGAFNNLVVLKWLETDGNSAAYYGMVNLILGWAILFSQVLNFGSSAIAVRFGPAFKEKGQESQSLFYTWIFPLMGLVLLLFFLVSAGNWFIAAITVEPLVEPFYLVLFLIGLVIPMTFYKSLIGVAVSNYRTSIVGFLNEIAIRVFILIGIAFYFLGWVPISFLIYSVLIAYFLQFLILWIYLGHFKLFSISKPDRKELKPIFAYGAFSVLDSGANLLANKIDVLMIGAMIGFNEVNYYNFAFFAATVITIPGRSLVNISSGIVADAYHRKDWQHIQKLYQQNSLNQIISGGFIFICIYAGINGLVGHMPEAYADAKYAFLFLGLAKMFDLLTSINSVILQVTPHYRFNFYFNMSLVILVIISNLFLIPLYGIIGASLATAACVLLSNILKTYFLHQTYRVQPFQKNMFIAVLILAIPLLIGMNLPEIFNSALFNFIYQATVTGLIALPMIWFANLSPEINSFGNLILQRLKIKRND